VPVEDQILWDKWNSMMKFLESKLQSAQQVSLPKAVRDYQQGSKGAIATIVGEVVFRVCHDLEPYIKKVIQKSDPTLSIFQKAKTDFEKGQIAIEGNADSSGSDGDNVDDEPGSGLAAATTNSSSSNSTSTFASMFGRALSGFSSNSSSSAAYSDNSSGYKRVRSDEEQD